MNNLTQKLPHIKIYDIYLRDL